LKICLCNSATMAAISAAWSRMTGRGAAAGNQTLPADLKRITHSGVMDIPKELLTPVIEASLSEDDRQVIMKHLRECLAEPKGEHWRRVHAGLVLWEELVKSGSPALISETAEGRHFDIVQRLSFLEHFDCTDKRSMNSVRRKAEALRKLVVPLIQDASLKDTEDAKTVETTSTGSPGSSVCHSVITSSSATPSTSTMTGFGSEDVCGIAPAVEPDRKRNMILNNIVAVGHSEDTTSESEGGDDKRAPVQYREPRRMSAKARNEKIRKGSSSDSEGENFFQSVQKAATQAPAQTVNLLDF